MPASQLQSFLHRQFTWRVLRLDHRLKAIGRYRAALGGRRGAPEQLIPVLVIIDVEPDGFFIARDQPVPWLGYETLQEFFYKLRSACSESTGTSAHYCWYLRMDPQIAEVYGDPAWAAKYYADFIDKYFEAGDEIGLHTHDYRWSSAHNSWVIDHGNRAWIDYSVRMSFAAFHESFGRSCESFRFGDRWMNDETLRLIESLGARFELTLEPGKSAALATFPDKPFTGSLPDYSTVPRVPFRPSESDFRKPDARHAQRIWMIPLSAALYPDASGLVRVWNRIIGETPTAPLYHTLNLAQDPAFFIPAIDQALRSSKGMYLAVVVRSDIGNHKLFRNVSENMRGLLAHPLARRFVFCTPAEAMRLLGLIEDEDQTMPDGNRRSRENIAGRGAGAITPADFV